MIRVVRPVPVRATVAPVLNALGAMTAAARKANAAAKDGAPKASDEPPTV